MRIRSGSLLVELYSLDYRDTYLFLKKLLETSSKTIDIVTYPNYFYGRRIDSKNTYVYIAGVYSIVVTNSTEELEKMVSNTKVVAYVVEKDAWIDTKKLDLEIFFKTLDQVVEYVDKCSSGVVELDNLVINTTCLKEECEEIIVVDYINAPLSWFSTSILIDEKTLLKDIVSRRPIEYILSYNVCGGRYIPLLIYKHSLGKTVISYSVSKTCRNIYKYILWSIVDILMR